MKCGESISCCAWVFYITRMLRPFRFVEQIGSVCRKFAIFDTFVSVKDVVKETYGGKEYWGRRMHEHEQDASGDERLKDRWASLDNPRSFWISRQGLYGLISTSGFTSAYDCYVPFEEHKPSDRLTVVALKGQPATVKVTLSSTPCRRTAGGL